MPWRDCVCDCVGKSSSVLTLCSHSKSNSAHCCATFFFSLLSFIVLICNDCWVVSSSNVLRISFNTAGLFSICSGHSLAVNLCSFTLYMLLVYFLASDFFLSLKSRGMLWSSFSPCFLSIPFKIFNGGLVLTLERNTPIYCKHHPNTLV